jgi:hypothetical protein
VARILAMAVVPVVLLAILFATLTKKYATSEVRRADVEGECGAMCS